jgi:site-specific recombinase XerD
MAGRNPGKSTASNREDPVGGPRAEALSAYLGWLEGRPLAARSREAYAHQVRRYLAWLGDRSPVDGDPLGEADARDWAVRDYKRHLKAVERWKPASVNLALAALDSFYTQLGLGRPVVRREELSRSAPRAVTEEEQRRLLRMAERASARDRAIVVVLLYTGLRLAELVALDLDDVRISARKGQVIVRSGKGDAYREVPLNALVRQVLEEWLAERTSRLAGVDGERALFVGRSGRRLSKRSVDDVVRGLGKDAGMTLSTHVLRHTFLTRMVRQGSDLVLVAELAGHRTSTGCSRSRTFRATTDRWRCRPGFSPTLRSSVWRDGRTRSTRRSSPAISISTPAIWSSFAGSTVRPRSSASRCSSARCAGSGSCPRT